MDKGGVVVVSRTDFYRTEALRQFHNPSLYRLLVSDLITHHQKILSSTNNDFISSSHIPYSTVHLIFRTLRMPIFYILPQIH